MAAKNGQRGNTGDGGFLPAKWQRSRRRKLDDRDRGRLADIEEVLHDAVCRGRLDLATYFARVAARLVGREGAR